MQDGAYQASGAEALTFDIHGCIGRGGFGEVYRATMVTPLGVHREVALKALRSDIDPHSDAVKRLRDEGRLLGALRHPAILRVHDLVMLDDRVALVMEFVDGRDLSELLDAGTMPLRAVVTAIGEVAEALDVAWRAPAPGTSTPLHLVHRDVKPANIRIGRHGEVKLMDFGIARATLEREAHTQDNTALGSLMYMSPERFHTERVDAPADIYGLGCVLFEAVTQDHLVRARTFREIARVMLNADTYALHLAESLAKVPGSTHPEVERLLRDLVQQQPDDRPSAAEVALRCEALADELDGPTLKRWCQEQAWEDPLADAGSFKPGRRSSETYDDWTATHAPTPTTAAAPLAAATVLNPSAELGLDDLTDEEFEHQLAWAGRRRAQRASLVAIGLGLLLGALLGWMTVGDQVLAALQERIPTVDEEAPPDPPVEPP